MKTRFSNYLITFIIQGAMPEQAVTTLETHRS